MLLVIFVLELFIGLSNEISQVGHGHYTLFNAFTVVMMQAPTGIYEVFPIVGFLGCLIGLGRLASHSELTIMRASGISINRIAWVTAQAAILVVVLMTFVGEYVAPIMQNKAEQIKAVALKNEAQKISLNNVWFYSNNNFIRVGKVVSRHLIDNVMIYKLDGHQRLQSVIQAKKGQLEHGDNWMLANARVVHLQDKRVTSSRENYVMKLYLRPKMVLFDRHAIKQDSIVSLSKSILYRKRVGLITNIYVFSLWKRLLQPFSSILMICLAVPFVFGSLRDSSMTVRFIIGLSVGFAFYMINQLFGPITMLYSFSAIWAAVLPLLLIMLGYCYLYYKVD